MRSRFSAYLLRDADYVSRSWAPETRPEDLSLDPQVLWRRLEIVDAPPTDGGMEEAPRGVVEFVAHCVVNGQAQSLHERSRFRFDGENWLYIDGDVPAEARRPVTKVGRNDPCPCGSGRKYKKCCGAN